MWSSSSEKHQHQQHKGLNKNLATHSSKSSSPSSSTSSSNNQPINPILINSKTMEEVWKDINLSSLNDHTCSRAHIDPPNTATSTTNFGGMILQDLLARPFTNDPPTATTAYVSPVPPPHPVTMLTLNSGPELHFFSSLNPLRQTSICQPKTISNRSSFEALVSPAGANGRKRQPDQSDNNSGDQKNKRMIKNRESAARSRARKQAYTNELEQEVANLMEENARLKRQQQQLCLASAGAQLPKKNTLYRTSTAPF